MGSRRSSRVMCTARDGVGVGVDGTGAAVVEVVVAGMVVVAVVAAAAVNT
jgi:hypothetical protein